MTTLLPGAKPAVNPGFDIVDLTAGTVTVANATTYRIVNNNSASVLDEFTGSFTYTNGVLTGGTITGWKHTTPTSQFALTNLSIPVANFLAYLQTGDTTSFYDAVFGGDDKMTGSALGDTLFGYGGDDSIVGGGGGSGSFYDALIGGAGNDTIDGGAGQDSIGGGTDNDLIRGGAGNDGLSGDGGDDTMIGGTGNDHYSVTEAGDVVIEMAGQGTDIVSSFITLTLGKNVENLGLQGIAAISGTGNELSNFIEGNGASNTLIGAAGNDTLIGGGGIDSMAGGKGNDVYYVDNAGDVVDESTGALADKDTVYSSINYTLGASLENLTLRDGSAIDGAGNGSNNVMVGNSSQNKLEGLAGNDSLTGGAGADSLFGGTGINTLVGGADGDKYYIENGKDRIVEKATDGGFDIAYSNAVSYVLAANIERLELGVAAVTAIGNAAHNDIIGSDLDNKIAGMGSSDNLDGGIGADTLDGGEGNDDLDGGGNNDSLIGGAGMDILRGGIGSDTMVGGTGFNQYYVDSLLDVVIGTAGSANPDWVYAEVSGYVLSNNVETLSLLGAVGTGTGNAGNNNLFGNAADNKLYGLGGNDVFDGSAGKDTMVGGAGDDTYYVDDVADVVSEVFGEGRDWVRTSMTYILPAEVEDLDIMVGAFDGTGNGLGNKIRGSFDVNILQGLGGDDTIAGWGGDDKITGGLGKDKLDGGANNDLLIAGSGGDYAFGGDGNDTIVGGFDQSTLAGGDGDDRFEVYIVADKVIEAAGKGNDIVFFNGGAANYVLAANVESLDLTLGSAVNAAGNALGNNIIGNTLANKILGLGGGDSIDGKDGNDTLDGGAGDDVLTGNGGNDSLIGNAGNDIHYLITGADTAAGGAGNDIYVIDSNLHQIKEAAGQGTDTVLSPGTNYTLGANLENLSLNFLFGGTAIQGVGNELKNVITGNGEGNNLWGMVGNDTIDGGGGKDAMDGGAGNDTYYVNQADDGVFEASGAVGGKDTIISSITFDLSLNGANVENLTLTGSAVSATGNALNNVLIGTDNVNNLSGGAGNDTMIGGLSGDSYYVESSKDVVVEAKNAGQDLVLSEVDYVLANNVEDLDFSGGFAVKGIGNALANGLYGNTVGNKLFGLAGNDKLTGFGGSDTLDGGADSDYLDGGAGGDVLIGGSGSDAYIDVDAGDQIKEAAGQGIDQVYTSLNGYVIPVNVENLVLEGAAVVATGNNLNNSIIGNGSNNVFSGKAGNDYLLGSVGDDTLNGDEGNDTLFGDAGTDDMTGGAGDDTYYLTDIADDMFETGGLAGGKDTVLAFVDHALALNFENLTLGGVATFGAGNEANNIILGNSLDNILAGNGGNDTISGGLGLDSLLGHNGNDSLSSGEGVDTLDGGVGNDIMIGGGGNDSYTVDSAGDKLVELVGGGFDSVTSFVNLVLATNVEKLTLDGSAISGTGNTGDNQIFGNASANKLAGLNGNDFLSGDSGNDTLDGGNGTDILVGGANNDKLVGGAGNDSLYGDPGNDTMIGGLGNDTFNITDAGDVVMEQAGQGTDTVYSVLVTTLLAANVEDLYLAGSGNISGTGNALNNYIQDLSGDATLSGGAGNDTLVGGVGTDTFAGGAGRDTFRINGISDGAEVVTDFQKGALGDALDISNLLSGYTPGASDPTEFVQFSIIAGDTYVAIDANGLVGGASFTTVAILDSVTLTNVNQAVVEGNLVLA